MATNLINPNPIIYDIVNIEHLRNEKINKQTDENQLEPFDALEIFDLVRKINDPEHPLTLEQLKVMQYENIKVDDTNSFVNINFTPTIPHCSMATLIGLCIRVKLIRSLPHRFKVDIKITPGTHMSEDQVNKQLNDKERVAAALENSNLLDMVNRCIANSDIDDSEESNERNDGSAIY
eukprot:TRINITY_DN3215_c5_g1_i1.p1 TRINITY_DN3215_c5_g1~~TRINITY_DN3215_c5_g1_i1.p1  ORF type:complete len:178 (-),score=76.93 TRINITY_DN3215_c5_g1_i1:152-685(-)